MSPANVQVNNGELDLVLSRVPSWCNGKQKPWTSGMVTTDGKFQFTYGVMEARIWVPGPAGGPTQDWASFWAVGQSWLADGELDVVETFGQPCSYYHAPGLRGLGLCVPGRWTGSWHTFSADWEKGSVTFYYDGRQVWRDTRRIASAPLYLVLGLGTWYGHAGVAGTERVQYVKVWQAGSLHPADDDRWCDPGGSRHASWRTISQPAWLSCPCRNSQHRAPARPG